MKYRRILRRLRHVCSSHNSGINSKLFCDRNNGHSSMHSDIVADGHSRLCFYTLWIFSSEYCDIYPLYINITRCRAGRREGGKAGRREGGKGKAGRREGGKAGRR